MKTDGASVILEKILKTNTGTGYKIIFLKDTEVYGITREKGFIYILDDYDRIEDKLVYICVGHGCTVPVEINKDVRVEKC